MNTGGVELPVLQFSVFSGSLLLGGFDALVAEGALLHHAAFAQGDVGVQLQIERSLPLRFKPVEDTNRVGAGVGAIACADATVVDLRVQTFRGLVTRVGGTDRLAGCGVALLAKYRNVFHPHVGPFALPVSFNANPGEHPAFGGFLFSHGRDIVFRLTGDDAGLAARAAVFIDYHAPLVGPLARRPLLLIDFFFFRHFCLPFTLSCYRGKFSAGLSSSEPAALIKRPLPSFASLTRVAAQACEPVSGSVRGANREAAFAPRSLAYRP